jgi:hypothetical protein
MDGTTIGEATTISRLFRGVPNPGFAIRSAMEPRVLFAEFHLQVHPLKADGRFDCVSMSPSIRFELRWRAEDAV